MAAKKPNHGTSSSSSSSKRRVEEEDESTSLDSDASNDTESDSENNRATNKGNQSRTTIKGSPRTKARPQKPKAVASRKSKKGKKRAQTQSSEPAAAEDDADIWTREDQVVLEASVQSETMAWTSCHAVFGMSPCEVIGVDEFLHDTGRYKYIPDSEDDEVEYRNTNMFNPIGVALMGLFVCPAFRGRPEFLRGVVREAMRIRLGKEMKSREKHSRMFSTGRNQKVVEECSQKKDLPPTCQEDIVVALDKVLGPDLPPDYGYIKYLPRVIKERKRHSKNPEGVLLRDLQAVQSAWDVYAQKRGQAVTHKKIEEYKTIYAKRFRNKRLGNEDGLSAVAQLYAMKKAWILKKRMSDRPEPDSPDVERGVKRRKKSGVAIVQVHILEVY